MHKIAGYLLLCVGLLFIFFSFISMYKVFVERQPAMPVVQLADTALTTPYGTLQIPMQPLNTLGNLAAFTLFMGFVLIAGAVLGALGCKLLKMERIYEALRQQSAPPDQEKLDILKKI